MAKNIQTTSKKTLWINMNQLFFSDLYIKIIGSLLGIIDSMIFNDIQWYSMIFNDIQFIPPLLRYFLDDIRGSTKNSRNLIIRQISVPRCPRPEDYDEKLLGFGRYWRNLLRLPAPATQSKQTQGIAIGSGRWWCFCIWIQIFGNLNHHVSHIYIYCKITRGSVLKGESLVPT